MVSHVEEGMNMAFKKRKNIISEEISVLLDDSESVIKSDELGINNSAEFKKLIDKVYREDS